MKNGKTATVIKKKAVADKTLSYYDPLKMEVRKHGDRVMVYATNQGKHIIFIKRMILRLDGPYGPSYLFLRKDDFDVGGEKIEQGTMQRKYDTGTTTAVGAQVSAEYHEVPGRSKSPYINL